MEVILAGGRQIAYEWIVPGIVYFDLETQRSFGDVGGSAHKDKMGMSVGVTYSTETGQYHIFNEDNVADLVEQLIKAVSIPNYCLLKSPRTYLLTLGTLIMSNRITKKNTCLKRFKYTLPAGLTKACLSPSPHIFAFCQARGPHNCNKRRHGMRS